VGAAIRATPRCSLETGVLAGGWDEVSSVSAARMKAYEHGAQRGLGGSFKGSECGGGPRRLSTARSIASDSDQRECVVCVGAVVRNRAAGVAAFEDGGEQAGVKVVCIAGHGYVG
jgi:hypothetical protein